MKPAGVTSLCSHGTESAKEAPRGVAGATPTCHHSLPSQPALPDQITAPAGQEPAPEGCEHVITRCRSQVICHTKCNEINAVTKHKQSRRSTFFVGIWTIGNLKKRPSELPAKLKMMPRRQSSAIAFLLGDFKSFQGLKSFKLIFYDFIFMS